MRGFGEKRVQKPPTRHVRPWVFLVVAMILIAGLAVTVYITRVRSKALQQEVASLRRRLEEIDSKAESARTRATEAEQSARQSATARQQAEIKSQTAEADAKQAREQAEAAEQAKQAAVNEAERIRKEREEEHGRLQEALDKIAETRRTAMGLVMNLDSNAIQFEFNKATLLASNREVLSRIAGILLSSKGYKITVNGHTDDVGSAAYNQELSERRAWTVRNYLVEAGISQEIISTKGYGKSKPLVASKSPEARAKNRRVEVEIVDTILTFHPPKSL